MKQDDLSLPEKSDFFESSLFAELGKKAGFSEIDASLMVSSCNSSLAALFVLETHEFDFSRGVELADSNCFSASIGPAACTGIEAKSRGFSSAVAKVGFSFSLLSIKLSEAGVEEAVLV